MKIWAHAIDEEPDLLLDTDDVIASVYIESGDLRFHLSDEDVMQGVHPGMIMIRLDTPRAQSIKVIPRVSNVILLSAEDW